MPTQPAWSRNVSPGCTVKRIDWRLSIESTMSPERATDDAEAHRLLAPLGQIDQVGPRDAGEGAAPLGPAGQGGHHHAERIALGLGVLAEEPRPRHGHEQTVGDALVQRQVARQRDTDQSSARPNAFRMSMARPTVFSSEAAAERSSTSAGSSLPAVSP